ncbi:hypothetical protein [Amycolatopsis sp. NPDC049868]|uniref:hypothetical protein n=1 Tax=Amycolatopsis sp. NPDC049868 TaxID=3363934 RepID=UPI0037B1E58E
MPGIDYLISRRQVRIDHVGGGAQVLFGDLQWFITDAQLSGMTAGGVPEAFRELNLSLGSGALPVVELITSDDGLRGLPWEAALPGHFVVRASAVQPRVLGQPLTLPIRMLQLDMTRRTETDGVFGLRNFGEAVRFERASTSGLERFRMVSGWPGVDVLHVTGAGDAMIAIAENGGDPLSTRLSAPAGSLGWLERLCAEARVRLLTLEGYGEKQLPWLRRLSGALVDRGGPATLIDGTVGAGGDRTGIRGFYIRMLRDMPLELALGSAPPDAGISLTLGRGASDLLRPSSIETGLRNLVTELRGGRREIVDFLEDEPIAPPVDAVLDTEHGIGWFAENDLRFDHEAGGLVPMARKLDDFRRLTGLGDLGAPAELRLWRTPESAPGRRYLNVALNDDGEPLLVGREYLLSVDIGPKDPLSTPIGALALLEEVFAWEPGASGAWAEAALTSLGLEVIGDPVQQVWIPRAGPSQRVLFTVTPTVAGVCAARLCLYVNQNVVQSVKIAARCVRATGEAPPPVTELARSLGLPDDAIGDVVVAAHVEYVLHALETGTPSRTLSLVVNDNRGVAVTTVKGEDVFGVYLAEGLEDVVEKVRVVLEDISGPRDADGEQPLYAFGDGTDANAGSHQWFAKSTQDLAKIGWKLYVEVFKRDRAKLRNLLKDNDGRISVAHVLLDHVIPWAVAYDREFTPELDEDASGDKLEVGTCLAGMPQADGTFPAQGCGVHPSCLLHDRAYAEHTVACPRHFWGFRHQIELPAQQSNDGAAPASAPAQVRAGQLPLMTIGMHGGLRFVDRHFAELEYAVGESSRPAKMEEPRFRRNQVIHDLKRTDQDVIYLYCHAEGGYGTNIDEPAFRVRRKTTPGDLGDPPEEDPIWVEHVAGDLWPHNPLIVLNGCRTAAFRPNALSKFIAEFVYARGAGGILATEIAVFEELASEIGTRFVRDFLDGKSAGQSLQLIRRDLLRRRNPLGLAYTLYATMDFHLGGDAPGTRTTTQSHATAGGGARTGPEPVLVTVFA